jgi:hypothetical protein
MAELAWLVAPALVDRLCSRRNGGALAVIPGCEVHDGSMAP